MNQPKIAGSGAAVMALVVTFALGRSPPPPFVAATPDPSRYAPIATKFCSTAKCRDGPLADLPTAAGPPRRYGEMDKLIYWATFSRCPAASVSSDEKASLLTSFLNRCRAL